MHFARVHLASRTIIAIALPEELTEIERASILNKRKVVLDKVKAYIDSNLDPKKRNILHPTKDNYETPKQVSEILQELDLTEREYYDSLSISHDSDYEIHFRRPPNSCFVNNYFDEGLLAWKANIDIQPVFNHYKAVTYMCAYFSKSEDESSQAMKQAVKDAATTNKSSYNK